MTLFLFICPAAEDYAHEPGKLGLCHIPFVLSQWQTAFPKREHEGWWEDSRAAQSDEYAQGAGKRNPFCLRVRRGGMCPREADFWMKLLNFSSDAQKWALCITATLGNLPWGSLDSCWLQQMERDFSFSLAMWGKFSLNQAFLKVPNTVCSSLGWIYWGGMDHDLSHTPGLVHLQW